MLDLLALVFVLREPSSTGGVGEVGGNRVGPASIFESSSSGMCLFTPFNFLCALSLRWGGLERASEWLDSLVPGWNYGLEVG